MTLAETIAANPAWSALPLTETSAQTIADALNAGVPRTKVVSREIGIGTVLDALGPTAGAALLDALDALRATVSPVKWAWLLLEAGTLDVGLASTRGQIDALTGAGKPFSTEATATIKALAEVTEPYTTAEVEAARNA